MIFIICLIIIAICTLALIISTIYTLWIYHKVDKGYKELEQEREKRFKS